MSDTSNPIKEILDMVHTKSEEILKNDPYYEYRIAVEWAKRQGLVSKLTPEQIQRRMDNREWRKVNKIIIQNENTNNNTGTSSDTGRK